MKIIIINGRGTSGKDKVVSYVTDLLEENFMVWNISSIDPAKQAAKIFGWKGAKTARDRKFLADLKQLSVEYNNHPTKYLMEEINYLKKTNSNGQSLASNDDIIFVHIREPSEIKKIVEAFDEVYTLYVVRHQKKIGNEADDRVEDYEYDFVLDNTGKWKYTISNINSFLGDIGIESKYIEEGNRASGE